MVIQAKESSLPGTAQVSRICLLLVRDSFDSILFNFFLIRFNFFLIRLYFRYLYHVMSKNQNVSEQNKTLLVETLRSVAEILIWGDQNDSSVFE